ncbi:hypothetical protein J4714_13990 [Staphylococcus epidermidis]|nr:hypothetical protein [Staphylococcus epidermidis]
MEGVEGMEALQGSRSRKVPRNKVPKPSIASILHCRPSNGKSSNHRQRWKRQQRSRKDGGARPARHSGKRSSCARNRVPPTAG